MKLQRKIEVDGNEVVNQYIISHAAAAFKLDIKPEQIKIRVWSETKKEFIPFKGELVKFIWEE